MSGHRSMIAGNDASARQAAIFSALFDVFH
jgi:hypothetical protein